MPVPSGVISSDNETEPFSAEVPIPPLVVAGFYDPVEKVCWIVHHTVAQQFYEELYKTAKLIYEFNAAYDIPTAHSPYPLKMLDEDRILDIKQNWFLYWFSTAGDVRYDCLTLEGLAKHIVHMKLDKQHELGDQSDRMQFRVNKPVTDSQKIYLAGDCVSTYYCGAEIPIQPTAFLQTRADFTLNQIGRNGQQVDRQVWDYWKNKLISYKDQKAQELKAFGFPVKEDASELSVADIYASLLETIQQITGVAASEDLPKTPKKDHITHVLYSVCDTYTRLQEENLFGTPTSSEVSSACSLMDLLSTGVVQKVNKEQLEAYLERTQTLPFFLSSKRNPYMLVFLHLMEQMVKHPDKGMSEIFDDLKLFQAENADWLDTVKKVGPTKFLQDYLEQLMQSNKDFVLDKTDSGKSWKFSKDDTWRLDDAGLESPMLKTYAEFKHAEKLLSTYLNEEFICSDGKIHPRFNTQVRSGRTSSGGKGVGGPAWNAQNVPSRDKHWLIRNVIGCSPGWVNISTDYSSIEMAAWAQHCWTRYGVSRMRSILNLGIDPHRATGALFRGVISPRDLETLTEADVPALEKLLEESIEDDFRSFQKVLNFGFPGALGAKTLYKQMRSYGMKVTLQEVEAARKKWIALFPEMEFHMKPERLDEASLKRYSYIKYKEDDNENLMIDASEIKEDEKYSYIGRILTGRVRSRCSYNAACNVTFQGLCADGIKRAMWGLYKIGLLPYIWNMIHDEFDYTLPEVAVRKTVPVIEQTMIFQMRTVIPDVRVKVETTLMRNWNKKGVVFTEATWDDKGRPVVPYIDYIKELKGL